MFAPQLTVCWSILWGFIMNKGDLIDAIAGAAGLSKAQAERALNSTIESITGTLAKGNSVSLIGFGTFSVSQRGARKGKNPRTGEAIKIAARKVAKFKAGKGLSDTVRGLKKAAKTAAPKAATKAAPKKAAKTAPKAAPKAAAKGKKK